MAKPNSGMKAEARKGLDWREEHGRGGTRVGAVRARQIIAGEDLSDSTIKRMFSFFSRHEKNKQAEGFKPGEEGYPSNGRIAWALWGGDAGFSWSRKLVNQMKKEDERSLRAGPNDLKVGDFVSWGSSGGRARGKIIKVERDGKINIPGSELTLTGTPEDPAALIQLYRGGEATDVRVGHKFSTLTKISPIRSFESFDSNIETITHEVKSMDKEDRHILDVSETDDAVVVKFAKSEGIVENELDDLDLEESGYKDEEDRFNDMDVVYRTIDLSRASYIDEEKRRVRIGVSSEEPVERDFGMEILSHKEGDVDMEFMSSGRAPLLLDHDMRQQIGVIEQYKLDQSTKRAVAIVRFGRSALADEVFRDVVDGIRQNISVGYVVNKMERAADNVNGKPAYIVGHSPMEVSIVSVPADQSMAVGVGRSKDEPTNKDKKMTEVIDKKPEVDLDEVRSEAVVSARQEFQRNSKEILDLATKHNRRDLADKAI